MQSEYEVSIHIARETILACAESGMRIIWHDDTQTLRILPPGITEK